MRIMGIEFASSNMHYVVLELQEDNSIKLLQSNRLVLGDTRSRDSLVAFQNAVSTLLNTAQPRLIGIKSKPENGQMRAGAAALKMEGIVLANSPCSIDFVSGARINACAASDESLRAYLQPALKAAHAALVKQLK
jgi:hypothetical protein